MVPAPPKGERDISRDGMGPLSFCASRGRHRLEVGLISKEGNDDAVGILWPLAVSFLLIGVGPHSS